MAFWDTIPAYKHTTTHTPVPGLLQANEGRNNMLDPGRPANWVDKEAGRGNCGEAEWHM